MALAETKHKKTPVSATRKKYIRKLAGRILILLICCAICFLYPEQFEILEGMNFFKSLSVFHILWAIWVFDMVFQIIPIKNKLPLGSQKLFANRFRPILDKITPQALKEYVVSTSKAAFKVLIVWCLLIAVIGILYLSGVIGKIVLFMISVVFYVCDLICVLIWCPFRLMMRTRCCTTCRIFNWDHLMMFSPMFFVGGFYALSLWVMSLFAWIVWEACVLLYPERFWERSNAALKCSQCTDKLCTQYCQKLR